MPDYELLKQAVADLDEELVRKLVKQAVDLGNDGAMKALEACSDGMEKVGDLFSSGDYFVGDLIFAGEIMKESVAMLTPALTGSTSDGLKTKVIICTVKGDLHDIGKNIVKSFLTSAGFEVIDLGIDVTPEKVVSAVKESSAKIVALSGVLTLAVDSMKEIVDALKQAGMHGDVKVIIGGNPTNEGACQYTGADAWAHKVTDGVNQCREWATVG